MPITTTANRVKKGGFWCEDADEITQKALDACGLTWDTEIPVQWGLEHLGLANTILGLGSPSPRSALAAKRVLESYLIFLYRQALAVCTHAGYTVEDVSHWITRDDRKAACQGHLKLWTDVKFSATHPGNIHLCEAMRLLYGNHAWHLKAIHAGKELLAAARILVGPEEAESIKLALTNYLRTELEKL